MGSVLQSLYNKEEIMRKNILVKIIALALVMCFGVMALVSCGGSDDTTANNNENNNNNVENNGGEENNSETPKEVVYVLDGKDGKSGYQIAKESGFEGSVSEWLDHFTAEEDAEKVAKLRELFTLKHELRVDENGDFKVLVLSDVQSCSTKINEETINNIRIVIDREDPDLVIFNGDNSYGMSNARLLKTYITNMADPVGSRLRKPRRPDSYKRLFCNFKDGSAKGI